MIVYGDCLIGPKDNANTHPNARNMRFAINSNLGAKPALISKLAAATKHVNKFHLYSSGEAVGIQGEYIRDGLDWNEWKQNCVRLLREGNVEGFHMMMTINALCLDTITQFLDWMLGLKREFGAKNPRFSVNILRFPKFSKSLTLPDHLRTMYHNELKTWLDGVRERDEKDPWGMELVAPWEQEQVTRLIEYLDVVKTPHRNTADRKLLEHDFRVFYEQYDKRRGKDFRKAFPRLVEWYDSLEFEPLTEPETDIQQPKGVREVEVYAHREVNEDGVVEVKEVRNRTNSAGEVVHGTLQSTQR